MFTVMWIFAAVLFTAASSHGQPQSYVTTCEEFEHRARFNPYEIIDLKWKIFYFWSNHTEVQYPVKFAVAGQNQVNRFKEVFDVVNPEIGVEWNKAILFMSPKPGIQILFTDMITAGAFRAFILSEQRNKVRPNPEPLTKISDIRMKIENRVLALMCCEDLTVYAMIRIDEVPKTEEKCKKLATTVGIKVPRFPGRSYLSLKQASKKNDEL